MTFGGQTCKRKMRGRRKGGKRVGRKNTESTIYMSGRATKKINLVSWVLKAI